MIGYLFYNCLLLNIGDLGLILIYCIETITKTITVLYQLTNNLKQIY